MVGTLNALAPEYTKGKHGSFAHVDPKLLEPGVRDQLWLHTIRNMDLDVLGMQEVEESLAKLLEPYWQTKWTQKKGSLDGCLMLVRPGIDVTDFRSHYFNDGTGHVAQTWRIGGILFVNTHLKFHKPAQLTQVRKLLALSGKGPAVLMGDFNDWPRPGGPVVGAITQAKFSSLWGDTPTAFVNGSADPLDILAVRKVNAEPYKMFGADVPIETIPTWEWPSDHRAPSGKIFLT